MILSIEALANFEDEVVMVDGSFDPIHNGHIEYFRRASELGFPVLCNIAPNKWTRKKHAVLLPVAERAIVLDSIRYISFVSISKRSTADSLRQIRPRIYAKGKDWQMRGGIPPEEQEICDRLGIQVIYVDSILNSSTEILANYSDKGR